MTTNLLSTQTSQEKVQMVQTNERDPVISSGPEEIAVESLDLVDLEFFQKLDDDQEHAKIIPTTGNFLIFQADQEISRLATPKEIQGQFKDTQGNSSALTPSTSANFQHGRKVFDKQEEPI